MKKFQPKILIVEDEPEISSILQSYLGRRGFQVSTTASGREALSFIQVSQPDVVILDLALRDLNGRSFLRELRQTDAKTQVVVITGQMLPADDVDEIKALGVAGFFHKPVILEKLGQLIAQLASRALTVADVSAIEVSEKNRVQEESMAQKEIHKLLNLLGIIRNKCENIILSRDEGLYQDRDEAQLVEMSFDAFDEIIKTVDGALDVIERMRQDR